MERTLETWPCSSLESTIDPFGSRLEEEQRDLSWENQSFDDSMIQINLYVIDSSVSHCRINNWCLVRCQCEWNACLLFFDPRLSTFGVCLPASFCAFRARIGAIACLIFLAASRKKWPTTFFAMAQCHAEKRAYMVSTFCQLLHNRACQYKGFSSESDKFGPGFLLLGILPWSM